MNRLSLFSHLSLTSRMLTASLLIAGSMATLAPTAARAEDNVPVRGIVARHIDPAPAGADALRVGVLGDGSGGLFQVRLLSASEDGVLTGYYAPPSVLIDFKGWKTLTFPLSSFTFHADSDPAASEDGAGSPQSLNTSTFVQFALTSTSTRIYLDKLSWTTSTAAPTDAPPAVIDDFKVLNAVPPTWYRVGDFNAVRSVTVGQNKVAGFVKEGSEASLSLTVREADENDLQLNGPALKEKLSRTPHAPYVIFARSPFDTITPDATPAPRELASPVAVSLFTTPGQIEPGAFTVWAADKIKDATVALHGPLTSKSGTLPASAVDIRVVRVAPVANGPELLMKDDRESLTGPLPHVRLKGDPITDIPAESAKRFWITVRTPASQAPGIYAGKLVFSAPGIKPATIPIKVEVLPLTLRTAHYQYGVDLLSVLGTPDTAAGEQTVTPEALSAELADIRDHDVKMVVLHDSPATLQAALQQYKDAKVSERGPVVVAAPMQSPADFTTIEGMRTTVGLPQGFDLYYRLPAQAAANADAQKTYVQSARAANHEALIVAPTPSENVYGSLSVSLGDAYAPLYTVSSDHAAKLMTSGTRTTPNRDWWSWSIGASDPFQNRLYAGFLLSETGNGLYGAFPGPYQYAPAGTDPYSIFNAPAASTAPTGLPVQMATFPVEGGVLDTVQWEAVRAGIEDVRYMDALKTISRELKDAHYRKNATDFTDGFIQRVQKKNLLNMTPDDLQALRHAVALQAVSLEKILSKAPKSAGD